MTACGHGEGEGHDCGYVEWRSGLVPVAEAMADAECPARGGMTRFEEREWSERWDAAFHRAMGRLTSDPFARVPN